VRRSQARHLATALAVLYLAMGAAEVVTHRDDTVPALLFWTTSLLGGGALVLAGRVLWGTHPTASLVLVLVGTLLGIPATAWTLLVPLLAVLVVALTLRDQTSRSAGQEPNASA
jgi:hypothetical protein